MDNQYPPTVAGIPDVIPQDNDHNTNQFACPTYNPDHHPWMVARRRSPLDNQRLNQAVKDMLDKDIIEPSSSDRVRLRTAFGAQG